MAAVEETGSHCYLEVSPVEMLNRTRGQFRRDQVDKTQEASRAAVDVCLASVSLPPPHILIPEAFSLTFAMVILSLLFT